MGLALGSQGRLEVARGLKLGPFTFGWSEPRQFLYLVVISSCRHQGIAAPIPLVSSWVPVPSTKTTPAVAVARLSSGRATPPIAPPDRAVSNRPGRLSARPVRWGLGQPRRPVRSRHARLSTG